MMKRLWTTGWLVGCALLSACGTRAVTASRQIPENTLMQAVVIGQSSKAQVLAKLGPTTALAFDSGYEVWLYSIPANTATWPFASQGDSRDIEFVILFGPDGVVKKTRRRAPSKAAPP